MDKLIVMSVATKRKAYFFGPTTVEELMKSEDAAVHDWGYIRREQIPSTTTVDFVIIGPDKLCSGGGHVISVKQEVVALLRKGYDIILDETPNGTKRPIHPYSKQEISKEMDAYFSSARRPHNMKRV